MEKFLLDAVCYIKKHNNKQNVEFFYSQYIFEENLQNMMICKIVYDR